jgi:hypothetical protein
MVPRVQRMRFASHRSSLAARVLSQAQKDDSGMKTFGQVTIESRERVIPLYHVQRTVGHDKHDVDNGQ